MKWFQIYAHDSEMQKDMDNQGVEMFARKREDGRIDHITVKRFYPHVDTTRTEIRSTWAMKQFYRVGRDAYGYTHPVSSKTASTLDTLWNYHSKRDMVIVSARVAA